MSDHVYQLERKNPKTGFRETTTYTGPITKKPRGWKVITK